MKILRISILATSLAASISTFAESGYIATNARVTLVGNSAGSAGSFFLRLKQGEGPCISKQSEVNVYFFRAESLDDGVYERAYANALTALAGGYKVNVYNYKDLSCTKAVSIELLAE